MACLQTWQLKALQPSIRHALGQKTWEEAKIQSTVPLCIMFIIWIERNNHIFNSVGLP
jgi:hypothetical protein